METAAERVRCETTEERSRRRGEAERYVEERCTEEEIALKAAELGWDPEDYRDWLVKVHSGSLVPSSPRGHMR